jgi:death on curing protein
MRYLRLTELIRLHDRLIKGSGGAHGIRDFGLLQSALAQPKMTFGGVELYPKIAESELRCASRWS